MHHNAMKERRRYTHIMQNAPPCAPGGGGRGSGWGRTCICVSRIGVRMAEDDELVSPAALYMHPLPENTDQPVVSRNGEASCFESCEDQYLLPGLSVAGGGRRRRPTTWMPDRPYHHQRAPGAEHQPVKRKVLPCNGRLQIPPC